MANEITVTCSLSYTNTTKNIAQKLLAISGATFNITGERYVASEMSVPTTAGGVVIPLGDLSTLGWAAFKNNDATNFVSLLNAVSGTLIIKVKPGEMAQFRFGAGISAPAAIADTAAVKMEYLILEN